MQINDANLQGIPSPATTGADRASGTEASAGKARAAAAGAGTGSDAIELSSFAQQINDLQAESPDREARISELKALVQSGEYEPDPKAIAAKLVDDSITG